VNPDAPFPMTVFWPERLARAPQVGIHVSETWAGFVRWASHPVTAPAKDAEGGFTLATLREGVRRKAHVESVTALAMDHDDGSVSADEAHAALSSVAHVVFTTASHTLERPRWRAVVPFDRHPTADEYGRVYPIAAAQFTAAGIALDPSTKDACRLWYSPTVKPGAPFAVVVGDGEPIRVDRLLAIAEEIERAKPPRPVVQPPAPEHRDRYVQAALQKAADAVSSASEGARHFTLSREAFTLARPELRLDEGQIVSALLPAFVGAAGERREYEGRRTIRDAVRAARGQS
jgi:hypothetical protein